MWKKYFATYKHAFQSILEYRIELVIWVLLDTLPTLLLFLVWYTLFLHQSSIRGYTLSQTLEYYLYTLMITTVTSAHFENRHVRAIREGKIDFFLTRPFSFLSQILWEYLANKTFYTFLLIPCLGAIVLFTSWAFQIHFTVPNPVQIAQFLLLFCSTAMIEYLIAVIIVLLGFWFEYAESLEHFKWLLIGLLSGHMMPRTFSPPWLRWLMERLPFQYMFALPIEIIQGMNSLRISDLVYLGSFIGFLMILVLLLWQHGKYRYSSAGG
jgi:ABC-2 type transport system permease protein